MVTVTSEIVVSNSNGSPGDSEMTDKRKRRRERKKKKLEEQGNALKNNDCHIANTKDIIECDAMHVSETEGSKLIKTAKQSAVSAGDDAMVQRVETDVKVDATLSQTQHCKSKKRKKKRAKAMEESNPSGNTVVATKESGSVQSLLERLNGEDRNDDQEFNSEELVSSATSEKSSVQNLGKANLEIEKDGNSKVNQDVKGAEGGCTLGDKNPRRMKKKKKNKKKISENSGAAQNLLELSNEEDMGIIDRNADQELASKEFGGKMENSATSEKSGVQNLGRANLEVEKDDNSKVNQDVVGAEGASTLGEKKKKKKKKKKRKKSKDSGSVQSLLERSDGEDIGLIERNADREASKDFGSKMENSATSEKCGVQNLERADLEIEKDENGKVNQDVVGAEDAYTLGGKKKKRKKSKESGSVQSLLERPDGEDMGTNDRISVEKDENTKVNQGVVGAEDACTLGGKKQKKRSKKKRSCADEETEIVENKGEVEVKTIGESICGNSSVKDKEREVDFPLSSSVAGQNNVAQGAVSGEAGDNVPRCTCLGHCSKKLLVLDLNGILADVVKSYTEITPDGKICGRSVFRRPFLSSFLEFCFERFDVGIWSSRRIGLSGMINIVMRNFASRLLFCMNAHKCTPTKFRTLENKTKPLVMKDLRKVWARHGVCQSCGKQKYDETNTLLVDDSPYKALCNPPHTGIFPSSYQHTDHADSALGPDGDLRLYLERLADAENVQKFVGENPFGEPAISESHESWEFYSKVLQSKSSESENRSYNRFMPGVAHGPSFR